jgi:two-component system OmpR family response regulator
MCNLVPGREQITENPVNFSYTLVTTKKEDNMTGFKATGRILIVEDDKNIAVLLQKYLIRDGFQAELAHDGMSALKSVQQCAPVLVILDLMLPVLDGWEVCRHIREDSEVPILMLTALEQEAERIRGFSLGADDYVVKPFSPREVVERVKAILRRTQTPHDAASRLLSCGELSLEPDKYRVYIGECEVSLTASEYTLLYTLMQRPGRVFTRDELIARLRVRGEVVGDRIIDVHIGHLRQKIETEPSCPTYILTKRGVGYHFTEHTGA